MFKNKIFGSIFIVSVAFTIFSCGTESQKDENAVATENVISEELHQAQCDLLARANEELSGINQKVRDLNDKIREKSGALTEAQNAALDDFEAKQISINKRMHEIKNIGPDEWETFKTSFEQDLDEIQALIDDISNDI